ncbi:hypothetical protein [Micromonospora sp. WMMD1082]|uniref:hypothetical protein n=1 Tax=Micromonospora sp. WMMD1082 TaxID=3016104 RepID=UPI002416D0CD|nr:hypothetical protein [Micromonospora sp. WMMD1082]MDG4794538.1 hypothetical protein [Micromonospora sp. WMMD1082]
MAVQSANRATVRGVTRADERAAARVLTEAFMQDPIWESTGPRWRWHRRLVLAALYRAELRIARWRSAIRLGAFQDGRLDAVILVYPDGERGFPWWAWLPRGAACLLAGPVAVTRSIRVVSELNRRHPTEPHAHFWMLGSRPGAIGAGYALMRAAAARTDALDKDGYLEATSTEMAEVKELLGWRVRDRVRLRTGKQVTTMWRDRRAPR